MRTQGKKKEGGTSAGTNSRASARKDQRRVLLEREGRGIAEAEKERSAPAGGRSRQADGMHQGGRVDRGERCCGGATGMRLGVMRGGGGGGQRAGSGRGKREQAK
ncbi:hypothetical protein B0H13DRAFT_1898648 [Mycena leptocephala]|nr:hypothetical protein B0H13DRAFT_1898648 [Mycena leptocephala]